MGKLRVAIIGCGNVSGGHIRAWLGQRDRAEIVALVDVVEEFARQRQAEFELPTASIHADIRAVLARADVDAVDICTPSHLHAEQIAAALKKKGASKSKYLATQVQQIIRGRKVAVKKVGRGQYVAAG